MHMEDYTTLIRRYYLFNRGYTRPLSFRNVISISSGMVKTKEAAQWVRLHTFRVEVIEMRNYSFQIRNFRNIIFASFLTFPPR